jgi:hypothetical protein
VLGHDRDRLPDRFRRVGAMDAVHRVAEIHHACTKRIAGATPNDLARNLQHALPDETVAADAYAVAHGTRLALDEIEMALLRVYYDGADTLLRAIEHGLPLEVFRKIVVVVAVIDSGCNVRHRRLEEG